MSSRNRPTKGQHEWTNFEKHTLLCLMAKNIHLEEKRNHKEGEAVKDHAYMNVATLLNEALNGSGGSYELDIDKREVARMIDRMLVEKKGVVGKGGYMERVTKGRITKGLKRVWEREPSIDYDGSPGEWAQWRKKREEIKRAGGDVQAIEQGIAPDILVDIWRTAGSGPPNSSSPPVNNLNTVTETAGASDLFNGLPAHLRTSEKYAWAAQGASTAHQSSHASTSAANIDSYRPTFGADPAFTRARPILDSYRPPPLSASTPSHSSSRYTGTARPTATRTSYEETQSARSAGQELPQRQTPFKRPGVLKHMTARASNISSENTSLPKEHSGNRTPGHTVNSARKALFEGPDMEMGEAVKDHGGRAAGTKANSESLPFNRLERRGGQDTEMSGSGY